MATVPEAKQTRPTMPNSTPTPMATRMSRPLVPAVLTLPVRAVPPLREVRGARALGSGGWGGLSRDAAAAEAAAVDR